MPRWADIFPTAALVIGPDDCPALFISCPLAKGPGGQGQAVRFRWGWAPSIIQEEFTHGGEEIAMDEHGLSESDSWRFLQKTAMNSRRKIHEIAADVVNGKLTP